MSTFAAPLLQNTVPRPVVRVIRQGERDAFIVSHFDDDDAPVDISSWLVAVVEIERQLCRFVDGSPGGLQGPYEAFVPPPDGPAGAGARDFGVSQPGGILSNGNGVANSYAVTYPSNLWPWPIPAAGRLATTPLVIVRIELRLPGNVLRRRPFGLAILSGDTT